MRVAVFGDAHGALATMEEATGALEQALGAEIAALLQVGDLGLFETPFEPDRATRRRAADDPTELGAAAYLEGRTRLGRAVYFVAGNHDRVHRGGARARPLDPAGRLMLLEGEPLAMGGPPEAWWLAGLGGVEGSRSPEGGIAAPEVDRLAHAAVRIDLLLAHDGPAGGCLRGHPEAGSRLVRQLAERCRPRFLFFGHYDDPPVPHRIGPTQVVPMNQADRRLYHLPGRDGAMGLLDTADWSFDFVTRGMLAPHLDWPWLGPERGRR